MNDVNRLFERAEHLLSQLERFLPSEPPQLEWEKITALRWQQDRFGGYLQPMAHPHAVRLADLQGIDRPKSLLESNTRQFIAGLPANNALLWGSRGTGKSSLIKALLNEYAAQGLRLIEVEKQALVELPTIVTQLTNRPERFIVFCDDLSFESNDPSYKALKVVLDGSLTNIADNILIYATSNRRHLLPEYMEENQQTQVVGTELHHGDAVEEKISLSERFGLWLSFHPFNQEQYLAIVSHWLQQLGINTLSEEDRAEALRWAQARGSRSGRAAWQFARQLAGSKKLEENTLNN